MSRVENYFLCLSTPVLSADGEIGQRRLMFIFRESKVCLLVYDPLEIYFSLDNEGTPERGPVLIPLLPYHVPHYSQLQPVLRVGGDIFFNSLDHVLWKRRRRRDDNLNNSVWAQGQKYNSLSRQVWNLNTHGESNLKGRTHLIFILVSYF